MSRHNLLPPVVLALAVALGACAGDADSPTGPSDSPAPSSGSAGCVSNVAGLPATVGSKEVTSTFSISAPAGCSWTARVDSLWADVAPTSGVGSRDVTLNIRENATSDSRTVNVTVNSQSFRIRQGPVPVVECTYSTSVTSLRSNNTGEAAPVDVITPGGCSWTASASESWLRVTPTSGVGPGVVEVAIASHVGDTRHAYVTIAGRRIDVTQGPTQ